MTSLCVVPARAGSKRVKAKNIRPLLGRPMISYSLETAHMSGLFSEVHVSTESAEVQSVVEGLGFAVPFLRPADLADDHTPLVPVLQWVLQAFKDRGQHFDSVCLLMSCAPLLRPDDLQGAYALFEENGCSHPVLSVGRFPAPAEWAYHRDDKGFLSPREPETLMARSQDLQDSYYDTGAFAIFPTAQLIGDRSNAVGDMLAYVLPAERAVDIDTEEDLITAEIMLRGIYAREREQGEAAPKPS